MILNYLNYILLFKMFILNSDCLNLNIQGYFKYNYSSYNKVNSSFKSQYLISKLKSISKVHCSLLCTKNNLCIFIEYYFDSKIFVCNLFNSYPTYPYDLIKSSSGDIILKNQFKKSKLRFLRVL